MKRAERKPVEITLARIVDRSVDDEFWSAVTRPCVRIDDRRPVAREPVKDAALNSRDDRPNRPRIVVCRESDQDIDFTNADELADKIVREEAVFGHLDICAKHSGPFLYWHLFQHRFCRLSLSGCSSESSQPKPVELIRSQG